MTFLRSLFYQPVSSIFFIELFFDLFFQGTTFGHVPITNHQQKSSLKSLRIFDIPSYLFMVGLGLICHYASLAAYANKLKTYWDNAPPTYAHIKYAEHLIGEPNLTSTWRRQWLYKWPFEHSVVVAEYGTGGGLLGSLLMDSYNASHYIAIDVSTRQLDHVATRLRGRSYSVISTDTLNDQLLKPFNIDVFISQATIQHFPSDTYLASFLNVLDRSNIPYLMLQIRSGDKNRQGSSVSYAQITSKRFLTTHLPSYKTVWHSHTYPNGYIFFWFRRLTLTAGAEERLQVETRSRFIVFANNPDAEAPLVNGATAVVLNHGTKTTDVFEHYNNVIWYARFNPFAKGTWLQRINGGQEIFFYRDKIRKLTLFSNYLHGRDDIGVLHDAQDVLTSLYGNHEIVSEESILHAYNISLNNTNICLSTGALALLHLAMGVKSKTIYAKGFTRHTTLGGGIHDYMHEWTLLQTHLRSRPVILRF